MFSAQRGHSGNWLHFFTSKKNYKTKKSCTSLDFFRPPLLFWVEPRKQPLPFLYLIHTLQLAVLNAVIATRQMCNRINSSVTSAELSQTLTHFVINSMARRQSKFCTQLLNGFSWVILTKSNTKSCQHCNNIVRLCICGFTH